MGTYKPFFKRILNCGTPYKLHNWPSLFSFWNILIRTSHTQMLHYLEGARVTYTYSQSPMIVSKKKLHPISSQFGLHFIYLEYFDPYKCGTAVDQLRGFLKSPTTQKKFKKIVVHPISSTIGLH